MKSHDLPRAPRTWSVWAPLLRTEEGTGAFNLDLPRPTLLVGSLPTIAATDAAGVVPATLDDIIIQVGESGGAQFTRQSGRAIPNAAGFVDARAFDTGAARVFDLPLWGPSELVIEVRWKVPALAANFHNAIVGVTFWGQHITRDAYERLIKEFEEVE